MGNFSWFSDVFDWLGNAFSGETGEVIDGIKDIARNAVDNAETLAGVEGEEKRKQAFEEIKHEAIANGLKIRNHAINTAIELAVAALKK